VATSAIDLTTAPLQQQITIASPPPGTSVGSPVVITGRTARYPFLGKLGYRFTDQYGAQLSTGAFNVNGVPGQGASFTVSLDFNLPPAGGPIRLELFDQNAGTGVIVANTALDMYVQPPQPARQEISIDTPPPGTLVGSPVVITGRTTLYPFEARLSYRVRGPGGQVLGEGGITVNGAPGQSTTFIASIDFRTPPGADTITIEIFEPSQATGGIRAIATIDLRIAPQPR